MFSLDLSKAYDRLDTSKLLMKLINYQISPYLIRFIDSWLKERKFRVRLNGVMSDEFQTTEGLPQGSPLSVGLWKLYVADFPVGDSNCQAFMDDIIFWKSDVLYDEAFERMKLKCQ